MSDYWEGELRDALKNRGVNLSNPNLTPLDAANEYMAWHYGAPLASEAISVFEAAKRVMCPTEEDGHTR